MINVSLNLSSPSRHESAPVTIFVRQIVTAADVAELMVQTLLAAKGRVKLTHVLHIATKSLRDILNYHYFPEKIKNNTYITLIRNVWR